MCVYVYSDYPEQVSYGGLAACGWRQTQPDGKQPFTVASSQSGYPTIQAYGSNSVEELTQW